MSNVRTWIVIAAVALLATAAQAAGSDGQPVYTSKCQMCHGADGAGKTPMGAKLNIADLRSDAVQNPSDADLVKVITAGKNKMQGYDGKLTKQQISDVAAYVRALKKK